MGFVLTAALLMRPAVRRPIVLAKITYSGQVLENDMDVERLLQFGE